MRILIVEDSSRLRESLADGLRAAGYATDATGDGRSGLANARVIDYDLMVLDLMLPELDGLTLLKQLRGFRRSVPVLILSAKDRVEDRVEGLRAGADDYLVKPFDLSELLARVEALTRRAKGVVSGIVRIGDVVFDLAAKRFMTETGEIALPPRDFALLEFLFLNAGKTFSRAEIEEHIYAADRQVWSNAVDSAVASVRRKLADAGVGNLIETRRGLGYCVGAKARA
ncbi:MAG: response regulator transcription factor [Phycisphaerae bacterium]|nr:response regulator transcription factor [Phycisphaerae bacterium]